MLPAMRHLDIFRQSCEFHIMSITTSVVLQPVKELVRPSNQLQLSPAELEKEIACLLTAANPSAPSNVAQYNVREHAYKLETSVDHVMHHYCSQGWLMHVDSEPAQQQIFRQVIWQFIIALKQSSRNPFNAANLRLRSAAQDLCALAAGFILMWEYQSKMNFWPCHKMQASVESKHSTTQPEAAPAPGEPAQLRNQFNYSDRAAQVGTCLSLVPHTTVLPPTSQKQHLL